MHAVYGPSESKCLVLSPTVGSNDKVGKKCLLLYVEGEKKRSFRSDPAFAVISAGDRDTLWLTLTHTDQRGQKTGRAENWESWEVADRKRSRISLPASPSSSIDRRISATT